MGSIHYIPIHKEKPQAFACGFVIGSNCQLQLGASGNQSLAGIIAGVLDEVLDEAASQIFSLLIPLSNVCVGVAGIQDCGINAGQSGGNFEVEVGDGLSLGSIDGAVQDKVRYYHHLYN